MPAGANACGYIGKAIIVAGAVIGIILSGTSAQSCDFLSFKNKGEISSDELMPPFVGAIEANVGIYKYEIVTVDANVAEVGPLECRDYDSNFDTNFEVLATSQILSIVSPVIAAFALLATLLDTCLGSYYCCFLASAIFFLAACGTQAGTFALYAEPSFCIDGVHECGVGSAGIQSAVACVLFWLCSVLTCCFPRPDPFCDTWKQRREEERNRAPSQPQYQAAPPPQQRVVRKEDAYDEEQPKSPKSPKKKKPRSKRNLEKSGASNRSNRANQLDGKINKKDFDTPEVTEGVERVEVKEKSFPDGSRQVDEITHYTDGSTSVKTKNYGPGE